MSCEICGRNSCTKSFHSIAEQNQLDNFADEIKERAKNIIKTQVNRIDGYFDNDEYFIRLDDVLRIIENY